LGPLFVDSHGITSHRCPLFAIVAVRTKDESPFLVHGPTSGFLLAKDQLACGWVRAGVGTTSATTATAADASAHATTIGS